MARTSEEGSTLKQQDTDIGRELLGLFLQKHRPIPKRPAFSRTSTLIVRKEFLPFYYAIYDHDLARFIELQYRTVKDGPLLTVQVPMDVQPPGPAIRSTGPSGAG